MMLASSNSTPAALSSIVILLSVPRIVSASSCNISLASSSSSLSPAQTFEVYKSRGVHFVKFWIYVKNDTNSHTKKLSVKHSDTFDPSLWVWAIQEGKYMLRLPLDSDLLSMGLLTFHEASVDVSIAESTQECLSKLSAEELWSLISSFLLESVVSLNASSIIGDEVICRSAYTFQHYFFTYKNGVGFKCCVQNSLSSSSNNSNPILCDTSYSDGWELVWIGPLVILFWIYVLVLLSLYKNIRRDYKKMAKGFLIVEQFIDTLKEDVITAIEKTGSKLQMARSPTELISFHEKVKVMDALGISKRYQGKFMRTFKILGVIFFIIVYYGYISGSIYYYWKIKDEILLLQSSSELYINVFGHIGWLFGNSTLSLQKYSIFETIVTFIIPFLIVFNYVSFKAFGKAKKEMLSQRLNKIKDGIENGDIKASEVETYQTSCFAKFTLSTAGRIFQAVSVIIILSYFVGVGSVYIVYSIFFAFLGIFVSLDALGTWLIPVMIFLYYITVAFNPLIAYYKTVKQKLFEICKEERNDLLISQTREMFLPRKLLDDFYLPRSREKVFATVQNILFAMAILMMIFLVLLCVQYPSMNISNSGSSILGVNIVILLPFIAAALSSGQLSDYEIEILTFDLTQFVKTWTNQKSSDKYKTDEKKHNNKVTNKVSIIASPKRHKNQTAEIKTTSFMSKDTDSNDNFAEKMENESVLKSIPNQPLLEPLNNLTK